MKISFRCGVFHARNVWKNNCNFVASGRKKKKKKKKGEEEEKETYLENSRMFFIVTLN